MKPRDFPEGFSVMVLEMRPLARVLLCAGIALLIPRPGTAQWVRLQRCNGAIPCMIPFGVRYAPDALISAQFGWPSPNSFSGRIALDGKPIVELDIQPSLPNFAREAAARSFVLAHTPPAFPPPPPPKKADD
jgi:hypothetical protein